MQSSLMPQRERQGRASSNAGLQMSLRSEEPMMPAPPEPIPNRWWIVRRKCEAVDMVVMQVTILIFVAIAGGAVVFTRNPLNQVMGLSFFGLLLAIMFFIFQAPDVAFSQIVVGAVVIPLMVLLTLIKLKTKEQSKKNDA